MEATAAAVPKGTDAGASDGRRDLCVFAHGMGGDAHDWDTWLEVLAARFPAWRLRPLASITRGARFLASSLDKLAELAAAEMVEAIRAERAGAEAAPLTLHCVGHSMGGLIIRGALPKVVEELGASCPELGHYLSLSSPHLGIQASARAPLQLWRNFCWLTSCITSQLAQLAIQDTGSTKVPYLVSLSEADGPYVKILGRFRQRTCATVANGDPLIPLASGVVDPQRLASSHSIFDASFWRFEERSGTDGDGSFERKLAELSSSSSSEVQAEKRQRRSLLHRLCLLWQWFSTTLRTCLGLGVRTTPYNPAKGMDAELGNPEETMNEQKLHAEKPRIQAEWNAREVLAAGSKLPTQAVESRSSLTWAASADGACRFPLEALQGLASVPWQRVVAKVQYRPMALNMHVFLTGDKRQQFAGEHRMSRQCIECLAEILAD